MDRWQRKPHFRHSDPIFSMLWTRLPARRYRPSEKRARVDLRKELRGDYQQQSITPTSPGIIYKDLYIIGGRNPEGKPSPPGDIRAFDVHTGAIRWTFHTIPHPGEFGYDTWPKDAVEGRRRRQQLGRHGARCRSAASSMFPTGSAVSDYYGV